MTRREKTGPTLGFGVVSLLVIVMAPAVLVAGELVNRHYLGWLPRMRSPARRLVLARRNTAEWVMISSDIKNHNFGRIALAFLTNPVWIALTAPARWILDHARPRVGGGRRNGNGGPPGAGVREPRRPKPDLPAGAMALPEPTGPPGWLG
jgi:hypothetical protein